MKRTGVGIKQFLDVFYEENTFICGSTATLLNEAATQLGKLNSENNTVLVTDPYLFINAPSVVYERELKTLLSGLKAKKIVYCAKSKRNANFFQDVATALQANGTNLEFDDRLEGCHDRFWYCPETEKCVVFGTSLNGIGRKISRIDMLTSDETQELKQFFIAAGIIASGDNDGT